MLRPVIMILKKNDDGKVIPMISNDNDDHDHNDPHYDHHRDDHSDDNDDDERVWLLSTHHLHNRCLSLRTRD